ncbi:hypothetical protein EOE67_06625 [Rheinheimera riviphila]|uniref:Lantibiotic dehydratase n=1 Tax=Rheinheimera riviphila TaxID=1834037 RepID=A0A437R0G3_9GAMM|nr:thiopeptide-type bacteriocin biosynthesis protein [Rheinheimera riviphila]RVU40264.1 hypothetical protein EOE67_06625 [Rheinheimera riviphila]
MQKTDMYLIARVNSLSLEAFQTYKTGLEHHCIETVGLLLNDPLISVAIAYAAPDLLQRLQLKAATGNISDKDICTIKKYLIRMAFRPTPFGFFSAVAPLTCADSNRILCHPDQFQAYVSRKSQILLSTDATILSRGSAPLFLNPTLYFWQQKVRYLQQHWLDSQAHFKLSEIALEDDLATLLSQIRHVTNVSELGQLIRQISPGTSAEEAIDYIKQLVDYDVLSTWGGITLTPAATESQWTLTAILPPPAQAHASLRPDHFVNLQASFSQNTLSERDLRQFSKDLYFLDSLVYPRKQHLPELFKQEFLRRYENSAVPLLEVLDTDNGITTFGGTVVQSEWLKSLKLRQKGDGNSPVQFKASMLDEYIIRQITAGAQQQSSTLDLADAKLTFGAGIQHRYAATSGLLVNLFVDADDKLLINYCGSYGPTSILWHSRFSPLLGDELLHSLQNSIKDEQCFNPELIYAEVLYVENLRQLDVIRRPTWYQYEIPLFVAPSVAPEFVIMPADLLVYLDNDEICLYSIKLKKRVIPRISSAHAYQHQQLNLYHFFGMLQNQNARTPAFQLPPVVTQLHYLPRIQYRNIILQKKRWLVPASDITGLAKQTAAGRLQLLNLLQLDRYISFGEADQILRLDLHSDTDLKILLQQNHPIFELYESLSDQYTSLIQCSQGMHYSNEVVIALQPPVKPYQPKPAAEAIHRLQPSILPPSGSELYVKIYGSVTTLECVLNSAELRQIITTYQDYMFFFVRYADPRPHLRLRLLRAPESVTPTMDYSAIFAFLNQIQPGRTEIEVAVYKREVSRYGGYAGVLLAEAIFSADSRYLLSLYSGQKLTTESDRMWQSFKFLDQILTLQMQTNTDKAADCYRIFNSYLAEYTNPTDILKHLSALYRLHKSQLVLLLSDPFREDAPQEAQFRTRHLAQYYKFLTSHCTEVTSAALTAVFHMHCNRMFVHYGRELEMLCYGLAYKTYKELSVQESGK